MTTIVRSSAVGPAEAAPPAHPEWQAYLAHRRTCPQCAQTTYLCEVGGQLLTAARTPMGLCESCGDPVYAGEEQHVTVRAPEATTRELVHRAPCKGPGPADTG